MEEEGFEDGGSLTSGEGEGEGGEGDERKGEEGESWGKHPVLEVLQTS